MARRNKLGNYLENKALKHYGVSSENWSVYKELIANRKAAKGTAIILNMSTTRFHDITILNKFFDEDILGSHGMSLYNIGFTQSQLAYIWRAWKPFIKSIRTRKQFVSVMIDGIKINNTIQSYKALYKKDNRIIPSRIEIQVSHGTIVLKVKVDNPERLIFYRSLMSWAAYNYIKLINNSDFVGSSSWRYKEIEINVMKGKVDVEKTKDF